MQSDDVKELSIRDLLEGEASYLIPMYQRNYAWEEAEIAQLIQDVIDSQRQGEKYYIGTLVVDRQLRGERPTYETIDGQQRLTTLALLASYLRNVQESLFSTCRPMPLRFESRERSSATLAAISSGGIRDDLSGGLEAEQMNSAILNGYRIIEKNLPLKIREHMAAGQTFETARAEFAQYLSGRVRIMRVQVPARTDLNHYFEVMNNRGEQLEKHEVLKARLMDRFKDIADETERRRSQHCLQAVWEACANMERYVQTGFAAEQRGRVFAERGEGWRQELDFGRLRDAISGPDEGLSIRTNGSRLDEIIKGAGTPVRTTSGDEDETPERFSTVINFPNFLLHVLRGQIGRKVPLDDKRLIDTFTTHLLAPADAVPRIEEFAVRLLRCKYLYDRYVIKREASKEKERWSLKRFKAGTNGSGGQGYYVNTFGNEEEDENTGEQRRVVMLLAALHVSAPTAVYKYWLNATLDWLCRETEPIRSVKYTEQLENIARAFVFDRFLAADKALGYDEIICDHGGRCQTARRDVQVDELAGRLSFDNIEDNLVFNYLDYLLWMDNERGENDPKIKAFEFTFRSSVEHYYPQNPKSGPPLEPTALNSFGNLCLISHSKNSALSNHLPAAKKEFYLKRRIDSIKQYLMMDHVGEWNKYSIANHYREMVAVLLGGLGDTVVGPPSFE